MGQERRPPWCREIDCPMNPGYDFCYIKEYVANWLSKRRKKELMDDYAERSKANPEEVIESCRRMGGRV